MMIRVKIVLGSAIAAAWMAGGLAGCASAGRAAEPDIAMAFIEEMDCKPADEQVPNWPVIRELMLREAPRVGDVAPDFELTTLDGTGTIRLSEFEPTRPVVLIFGSWT